MRGATRRTGELPGRQHRHDHLLGVGHHRHPESKQQASKRKHFACPGRDSVRARGGAAELVRCGRGRDRVAIDRRDRLQRP